MAERHIRQISGEVFSARQFYERCVDGDKNPDGRLRFQIDLPTQGTRAVAANNGSLIWIDGVYADAVRQEQFFAALLRGDTPAPILDRTSRTAQARSIYTAPEIIGGTPQTILAACGLAEVVCDAAVRARYSACPQCGAPLARYTSPLELLHAVTEEWRGTYISFFAESPEPDFSEWTTSLGLPLRTSSTGFSSVCLDQFVCQLDTAATLGTLLHSMWRVPNVRFFSVSDTGASRYYAPAGWCNTCNLGAPPPARARLLSILTRGLDGDHTQAPEALLTLEGHYTVGQLLVEPMCTLPLSPESPLIRAQQLIASLSLDTCSFGSRTDTLDARDLAKVSVISSLLRADRPRDQLILDLPRGIFGKEDPCAIHQLIARAGASHGISVVGDPFESCTASNTDSNLNSEPGGELLRFSLHTTQVTDQSDRVLHIGELIQVRRSTYRSYDLFHDLTTRIGSNLKRAEVSAQLWPVPVFENNRNSTRVIGEELGLLTPLAQLYAASLDARMHGLTAKDFVLFGTRSPRYACSNCRGLGVQLTSHEQLPRPVATPCPVCRGQRCKSPVSSALFRGVSFSTALNQSIERSADTLTALSKAKETLHQLRILELQHLPLGMPLALLSTSELRRLRIVQALTQSRTARPSVVVFEEPGVGLLAPHRDAIAKLRDAALKEKTAAWIEVL